MNARDVEQQKSPNEGSIAGSMAIGAVMMLVAAPIMVHEARSAEHASLVPWLLAAGPIFGLLIAWVGGSFRDARPTPRAQATHFALAGAFVVSLLLVIALGGPTGVVLMALTYGEGWLLLTLSISLGIQRRQARTTI
jgi:hypothetical protein